mmetsp:Transcript_31973/g.51637  ORF Transcript_31973/g.51637 Transcript_31973/m.51637 type:complete len:117 (+) Transcript_31973:87-437(+)|eukprot:CAMPEP_0184672942 /NCGR_PEP_ID=MMETSP0308-20130426/86400_1 /TAXON_ID=38269 /ORGANISM="Gloeochaete witrockiana, Strain SAG 46.84" /LENGTH=116 /DNA_ID=CAMNT_0027120365 /DNA_START=89 /DNA_END=439 /DNA_ORIENTATION=-
MGEQQDDEAIARALQLEYDQEALAAGIPVPQPALPPATAADEDDEKLAKDMQLALELEARAEAERAFDDATKKVDEERDAKIAYKEQVKLSRAEISKLEAQEATDEALAKKLAQEA